MIDQRAERDIIEISGVQRIEGKQEVGDVAKPLFELELGASLSPLAAYAPARIAHLGLAYDALAVPTVLGIRPQARYFRIGKVLVFVREKRAVLIQVGVANELDQVICGFEEIAATEGSEIRRRPRALDDGCFRVHARHCRATAAENQHLLLQTACF